MKKLNFSIFRGILVIILSATTAFAAIVFLRDLGTTGADSVPEIVYDPQKITTITFTEESSHFSNPERGWYRSYFTDDIWDLDSLRKKGISTIQLKINLKEYTDMPIGEEKLTEIKNAFQSAEKYGLQVIFRAAYDFDGIPSCEPKELSLIVLHIEQLRDVFYEYEGVLWFVQTGFLGPWGEWHSSLYGDIPSFKARKTVTEALLKAVPESRAIQVRRPSYIRDIIEDDDLDFSRIGYHNDSLLSTDNEYGTYIDSNYDRKAELQWTNNVTFKVPFAGETCCESDYSDPQNAIYELDMLNAHTLNIDYHLAVIDKWKSTEYNGVNTFGYISDNLGYRFVIEEIELNETIDPGGILNLNIKFRNDGFGTLINYRDVEVILSNGRKKYISKLNEDPTEWKKEDGLTYLSLFFSIPSDIKSGNWKLYLNLPNNNEKLKENPNYSVRFANKNVWDEKTGYNILFDNIFVFEGGEQGEGIKEFKQISRELALQNIS